ncbi:hypothetical protein [Paenibacillus glucanolyticus]|uniref:hypothetical protein n=1 Tax=Paenibacillus glucanolyticus TaxID=59843 RepID=UPI00128BAC83|nr:hypothetical protein [Paenibacillus glucanolyticus]MPY20690.1 hypothetical protein [Paenibacillus glucanolyticus]
MAACEEFQENEVSAVVPKEEEELFEVIDGPYGPIEIIAVKRENSTALADLHRTIAEIMVKQAKKKAAQID